MGPLSARYAVCENALRSGDFATDVAWAQAAGAAALGVDATAVATAGPTAGEVLAQSGLCASSLMGAIPPTLTAPSPAAGWAAAEREVAAVVDRCARLGAPGVLLTPGPRHQLSYAEADRRGREWLARMGPLAAERGVRLLLEPVHPLLVQVGHVHTLAHGAELVADIPGAGLVLDVGHLWWDRRFTADLADTIGLVGTVQIDDVDPAALADYRYARTQLGDGVVPVAEMVAAIEGSGYDGFYENESSRRSRRDERVEYFAEGGRRLVSWLQEGAAAHP